MASVAGAVAGASVIVMIGGRRSTSSAMNAILPSITSALTRSNQQLTSTLLPPVSKAESSIQSLYEEVRVLNSIFQAPKTRGLFGEAQLETIIRDALPRNSYEFQANIKSGTGESAAIPDCIIKIGFSTPICVDAKFPLDKWRELNRIESSTTANITSKNIGSESLRLAKKSFAQNLSQHINNVAKKYIIPGITTTSAILFLPSESLFASVIEICPEVLEEARRRRVWVCGPNTLMAVVFSIRGASKGGETSSLVAERAAKMTKEVESILGDVDRLLVRSQAVDKQFEKARESLRLCLLEVSAEKVRRKSFLLANAKDGDGDDDEDEDENYRGDDKESAVGLGTKS